MVKSSAESINVAEPSDMVFKVGSDFLIDLVLRLYYIFNFAYFFDLDGHMLFACAVHCVVDLAKRTRADFLHYLEIVDHLVG